MQIKFWGTRGSLAITGRATERYGGNTACVEVRSDSGVLIVLDCGTGGHALGRSLVAEKGGAVNGHLLISHTHWDHIQGVPFFTPFFIPGSAWEIYGPGGLSQSIRATLAGQMEHTYFPIALDQFAASIVYQDLVEGDFTIEDVRVQCRYLNHPALTLAYRLEVDGTSMVYCCDHEPFSAEMASGEAALTGMDRRYADFVAGADLVIHDSQYTAQEYPSKIGWGHSTVEYAVRVCRDAGVKRLVLTHYDPSRVDTAVDSILEEVRKGLRDCASPLEVLGAAEGMVLNLTPDPASPTGSAARHFEAKTAIGASYLTHPVLLRLADTGTAALVGEALAAEEIPFHSMTSDEDLQRGIREDNPSLIIIEHRPPLMDGLEIARAIRRSSEEDGSQVPVVLVSAASPTEALEEGVAVDWLSVPFTASYARARIRAWVLRAACRWVSAPLPDDEVTRVAALRKLGILDTPPEERFDRLTRIAAAALDVPVALVSLLDSDRQWFKSTFGLPVRETPRDVSFCAHALLRKEELIVNDACLDDRFADTPVVLAGPRIRAYTGVPLLLDDGSCIGTFCVVDTRPRDFNETELAVLRDLRDLAMEEIQRARPDPAP